MSDFHQTGLVATFHRLGEGNLEKLERSLEKAARHKGISLVLPCLYQEIGTPALDGIIRDLKEVRYIREVVVTLGPTEPKEFANARKVFGALPQPTTLLWNSGPRIQAIYEEMRSECLEPGPDGKGRSAWMAYGYVIAERGSQVIALHDCDIVNYSREILGRLVFPVASDRLNYEFCKGYYSRVTTKMHGRVTRLFVTPLVRSLIKIVGTEEILRYYDSFRYPLAGEIAMEVDLARTIRTPSDWGLEVGMLAEVYRNCSVKRICQSELCANYEHKHQALSLEDKEKGLNRMANEIAKCIFRNIATEGIAFTSGFFNALRSTYLRMAQDTMVKFHGDALMNGLDYDRHTEGKAVEMFAEAIRTAGEVITLDPHGPPQIPNWNRVFAALPDLPDRLLEAVKEDNS